MVPLLSPASPPTFLLQSPEKFTSTSHTTCSVDVSDVGSAQGGSHQRADIAVAHDIDAY